MRSGITMKTDDDPTTGETVTAARRLLNSRVDELQRANGITKRSDLSIAEAVEVIRALTSPRPLTDGQVIKMAGRWHNASLLSEYLDIQSMEYQRDHNRYGVYVLFDLNKNKLVPLLVDSEPKYVGESGLLSTRLRQHASGSWASGPANRVVQDYLRRGTRGEQADFSLASRTEQRELRGRAMKDRRLWVQTIHTANKADALRLEDAKAQFYWNQGYDLWNERPKRRPYIA